MYSGSHSFKQKTPPPMNMFHSTACSSVELSPDGRPLE